MNDHLKNIFDEGDCLTEEQLRLYVSGKLNSTQQNRVEKHLLECEMCSDAVEGIRLMNVPENLKDINIELKEKINVLLNGEKEKKVKILFPWRIAASFALIFISGLILWLFIPKKNNQQIFTQEYKPYPATATEKKDEPVSVPPVAANEISQTVTDEKKEIKPQADFKIPAQKNVADRQQTADNNFSSVADESVPVAAEPSREMEEKVAVRDEEKKDVMNEDSVTVQSVSRFSVKEKKISEQDGKQEQSAKMRSSTATMDQYYDSDTFQMGMNAYKKEDYKEAVKYFDVIKDNADALFYGGVSYLSLNNPQKTIEYLNEYRKTKTPQHLEASYWYEALAQIKLNNKTEAKRLLEGVIKFNAEYYEQARKLVQQL